jgi:hypothetical protein
MNTTIGFPSIYWEQGFWSFFGYLLICLSLGVAIKMMITMSRQSSAGPLPETITLLVLVAILLQFIPSSQSGFQFLPISPWSYSGWLSFLVSVCVWCFLILGVIAGRSGCPEDHSLFSGCLLTVVSLNALLSFSEHSTPQLPTVAIQEQPSMDSTSQPKLIREEKYKREVKKWKSRASQMRIVLQRLRSDKGDLTATMHRFGNSENSTQNAERSQLVVELAELQQQIVSVERALAVLDSAVMRTESHFRRLARHDLIRQTGNVKEAEFEAMSRIQRELQDDVHSIRSRPLSIHLFDDKTAIAHGFN